MPIADIAVGGVLWVLLLILIILGILYLIKRI